MFKPVCVHAEICRDLVKPMQVGELQEGDLGKEDSAVNIYVNSLLACLG